MTTYAFGDVHGCLDPLQKLLARCLDELSGRTATLVFLGDYIDRGPNSKDVIQLLMDLQRNESRLQVICLTGNHESMALSVAKGSLAQAYWMSFGGAATLRSYGVKQAKELPKQHLGWLQSLPTRFDDGLRLFVHAGIRPDSSLDRQSEDDLLWIREPFLSSTADHGRLIVHGHTPTKNFLPDLRPNRLNLDSGAVFGGSLTAAVFNNCRSEPIRFLSQPCSPCV